MTSDARYADTKARDQIRTQLDETLFVEASAGTGKTAALVERYVALVLAGRPVDRIVAITFTEKAAAELRDRVRQGLEAHLAAESDDKRATLVREALGAMDRAQISTIHAFCQTLLRLFAVRAGIDPAFEVQDEVAAQRRFEERWRAYLDELGSEPMAVQAAGRLLDLGMTPIHLQELAQALWSNGELAERLHREPLQAAPAVWPDIDTLRRELLSIPTAAVPRDDKLRQRIESLIAFLDELIAAPEERDARLVGGAAELNPKLTSTGRAPNWRGSAPIGDVRDAVSGVVQALADTLASVRSAALAGFMPYAVRFVLEEAAARGRDGALTFDDLILKARDVLRDIPEARARFRERYDTLLIDEFQDTDPLQADIALYFAADPATDVPEPGRLFLVGDPKQSIYRFRRADMAMYAATGDRLRASGASDISLSLNRRSQPQVIEWVNHVFERVIGPGENLEVQPAYRALQPDRAGEFNGPGVACFGGALDEPAGLVRQRETRMLAAYCREAVRQGWQVYDRTAEVVRPARYGDIAVLLPARTVLQPLERALADEGIPYRVEGGSLVYATQEVRDVINCLTAIDDPSDDVAVVAALRSPAYACSDVEIATYRLRQGGSFNYLWPQLDTKDGPVAEALKDLRDRHKQRGEASIASLIEAFVNQRRLVEIGLLDTGNRNAFRRARFLVEQARSFESRGPESLRSFVEWLERRATEAVLDYEGAALDDDEDAVRVLTVHAAKGLEFPIVFIGGLGSAPRNQPGIFEHHRQDGRIAVQAGRAYARFTLGPAEEVRQHERAHEVAERNRLLYVAATRARDHLVVSLFHKQTSSPGDTAAEKLLACGTLEAAGTLPPVDLAPRRRAAPFQDMRVDPIEEESFAAGRAELVSRARTRRFTSATGLSRDLEREYGKEERARDTSKQRFEDGKDERFDEEDTQPWSHGRGGTHLGRAVHAALQSLPWDADDAAIEAAARAQTVAEAIPKRQVDAERLIRVALASQAAQRARAASRAWREVPFAFRLDTSSPPSVVEGFIDLVIEHEDGIEIVDWKTDDIAPAEIDERLRRYQTQAGLYVLGLEKATGRRVTAVTYVFVSANEARSPGEPVALAAAALQRLEAAPTSA